MNATSECFVRILSFLLKVLICLTILCVQMGPSALAGFSLFVLLTPLQERAMTLQLKMRRASMKYTDKRANLLQE